MINFLFGLGVAVTLLLVQAMTIMFGWNWFIAPMGVMEIGLFHALGVRMLVGLLTLKAKDLDFRGDEQSADHEASLQIVLTLGYLVSLVLMWLVSFGVGVGGV